MNNNLSQIEFYFPKYTNNDLSRSNLAKVIVNDIIKCGSLNHSGFSNKGLLFESIKDHLGDAILNDYLPPTKKQIVEITQCINSTLLKCNEILKVPTKNYIFIFPLFPSTSEQIFNGVMGWSTYSCVFQIYLDIKSWTKESLSHTVAHELSHTIFFYHHYKKFMSGIDLLDTIVAEGIAEVFREQVIGGNPAKWSISLNREEVFKILKSINEKKLHSRDQGLIKEIIFGSKTYKEWTGYSLGYWLVKEFVKMNPDLSWIEIIKSTPRDILTLVTTRNI